MVEGLEGCAGVFLGVDGGDGCHDTGEEEVDVM